MSKITGKQFSEPFGMRIVSGMLVNGSVLVSWATGKKASSQLDWGFDPSVPNRTPEYNAQPKDMKRYHQIFFPTTYLDTWHYFRVRSRTVSGKLGVSPIYKVYVSEILEKVSDNLSAFDVTAEQISFAQGLNQSLSGLESDAMLDAEPIAISEVTVAPTATKPNVQEGSTANQVTTFETNINTSIS